MQYRIVTLKMLRSELHPDLNLRVTSISESSNICTLGTVDHTVTLGTVIGVGGFGHVFKVYLNKKSGPVCKEDEIVAAMKHIEYSRSSGLTSLLEVWICKYVKSPYLQHAINVDIDISGSFHIIQPLALGDAAAIVRRGGNKLSAEDLKRWCWQLVSAVAHLHCNGIAHCDIKASNVLAFGDDATNLGNSNVKLCDYGLCVMIMDPKRGTSDLNGSISYTSTHRPLEVWKGTQWSYSADMWALGCTFYELGYQHFLFPDQKGCPDVKEANIMCIQDWGRKCVMPWGYPKKALEIKHDISIGSPKRNLLYNHVIIGCPIPKSLPIAGPSRASASVTYSPPTVSLLPQPNFKPCNIDSQWEAQRNHLFNDLLLSMLNIDPTARATIWDLIDHPFFDDVRDETHVPPVTRREYPTIRYPYDDAPPDIVSRALQLSDDPHTVEVAISLYRRAYEADTKRHPSINTCITVAHKILYKTPPRGTSKVTWADVKDEILVCRNLEFRLLCHADEDTT